MTSIPDLLTGFVVGALLLSGLIYFFPYRLLVRKSSQYEQELLQLRGRLEETETRLFNQERRCQADLQIFKREKSRLEAQGSELEQEYTDLEHRYADQQTRWQQEHEQQTQTLQKIRESLQKAEMEVTGMKEQLLKERSEWQQERENLDMEAHRLRGMVKTLEQAKASLQSRIEEQQENWEQKRLELDMQVVQARTEMMKLHSKLKNGEVSGGLDTPQQHPSSAQLMHLQAEKLALQDELVNQRARAAALEEEINDLMQRMLRSEGEHR